MQLLRKNAENDTGAVLPNKISLVCDGLTTLEAHYKALFVTFHALNLSGFQPVFFAFSPLK